MKKLVKKDNFDFFENCINLMCSTKETKTLEPTGDYFDFHFDIDDFATEGIEQAGVKLGFPANYIKKLANNRNSKDTANYLVNFHAEEYLQNKKSEHPVLFERRFFGKIYGLLSEKYAFFDDTELLPIIKNNNYLMDSAEYWGYVSPTHTHLRFVSKNKLFVNGDDSPLSMCVFIDNSMVGMGALKIRFGLYRWACTNGMISNLKEFTIVKESHLGEKDFSNIVLSALDEAHLYEKMLIDKVERMNETKTKIYAMDEEDAIKEIKNYLSTSKKIASKIYQAFILYGGATQWDLCNAITDVAHDVDIETRLTFEAKAMSVPALKQVA